jgi:hypothetical protein
MPGQVLFLLLAPEEEGAEGRIPSNTTQQKVIERARALTAMLARLLARCDVLIAAKPGLHAAADYRQRWAAEEGWYLMRQHGKAPTGGNAASSYGRVAGLLYEGAFGEVKDLERACRQVLSRTKEDGLPIRRHKPANRRRLPET